MQLDLTPEEEKLARKIFEKSSQTPEEAFMSLVYQKVSNSEHPKYPKMENPHVQKISADVDEDGILVISEDAPEHVKDWVRHG